MVTFPNGKKYIGITSKSLERRKIQHFSSAKKGSYYKFHKALLKYKAQEEWTVVGINLSWKEAVNLEVELIKQWDTFKNGYNMTRGGEGSPGRKMTNEQRVELARKTNGPSKPFYMFDSEGKILGRFEYIVESVIFLFEEKNIKVDIRNIYACLNYGKRSCKNHYFSYQKDFKVPEKKTRGLKIKAVFPDGKEVIYRSKEQAAEHLHVSSPTITQRINSKTKKPLRNGVYVYAVPTI